MLGRRRGRLAVVFRLWLLNNFDDTNRLWLLDDLDNLDHLYGLLHGAVLDDLDHLYGLMYLLDEADRRGGARW